MNRYHPKHRQSVLTLATGWVALSLWTADTTPAQIVLTGTGNFKTSIDFSSFSPGPSPTGVVFANTLKQDLMRSGWFSPAAPGEGELTLRGRCQESGGKLTAECRLLASGNPRIRLNEAYSAPIGKVRRFAHRVADAITEATGRKGFAAGRIVMVGSRSGHKELYLTDSDGQSLTQLTKDRSVSVSPKWGPDSHIVYTSFLKGYPDVYRVNIVSGNRDRISNLAGLNTGADISPDGREIVLVLSKDGNPEIYTKKLSTGALTRVTRTRAAEASPNWSPDGRKIVYVADGTGRPHLYTINRSSSKGIRVPISGSENVSPDWGDNGKIAYSTRLGGRYQIAVFDPKTRKHKVVPTSDNANYEDPSWAPNGRHIACTRTQNYRSQVYILDTRGDAPLPLTTVQGDWFSPSWSPP